MPPKSTQLSRREIQIANYFDKLIELVDSEAEKELQFFRGADATLDNESIRVFKFNGDEPLDDDDDEEEIVRTRETDRFGDTYLENEKYKDCYEQKFTFEKKLTSKRFDPKKTTVDKYMSTARDEMIDELKKMKDEALKNYRSMVESDQAVKLTESQLKSVLFAKNFCFIIEAHKLNPYFDDYSNTSPLNMYLVIIDFYLNEHMTTNLE